MSQRYRPTPRLRCYIVLSSSSSSYSEIVLLVRFVHSPAMYFEEIAIKSTTSMRDDNSYDNNTRGLLTLRNAITSTVNAKLVGGR